MTRVLADCTDAARLLPCLRLERVRWAIDCELSGTVGSMMGTGGGVSTLGSDSGIRGGDSGTFGRDGGLICDTLGDGAGVPGCVEIEPEGGKSGAGWLRLKIARRLSIASSWAWQLSGVLSARTATVRARRQWMILSVVVSVGTERVGC